MCSSRARRVARTAEFRSTATEISTGVFTFYFRVGRDLISFTALGMASVLKFCVI